MARECHLSAQKRKRNALKPAPVVSITDAPIVTPTPPVDTPRSRSVLSSPTIFPRFAPSKYGRAPYWLLQLARDNRTGRSHDGNDKDGRPLTEWSVDGTMESFQHHHYKNMAFKNDIDAWTRHTINMPVVSQAITHSDLECSRRYDVDSYEAWKDDNSN